MNTTQPIPPNRKTVLITGCSPGGIGHALARAFNAKGIHVFATARKESALDDLRDVGIEPISLEMTSAEQIAGARKYVEERTGGTLDILVNNAGRNYGVPALDADLEEARRVFDTNFFAVMQMCKEFSPLLIKAKGTIVNIGSVAAEMPYAFGSVYNATKAALHSYSDDLRVELKPFDVKVMVVVTGGVKSNIARVKRTLPEDSLYAPLEPEYRRRQQHSQTLGMDTDAYAESVVKAALKSHPPRSVWRGGMVGFIWLAVRIMPGWFWDFYNYRLMNFNKLVAYNKAHRKEE